MNGITQLVMSPPPQIAATAICVKSDLIAGLPTILLEQVSENLHSGEAAMLADTSIKNRLIVRNFYRQRLLEMYQHESSPEKAYAYPQKRKDRFIPCDRNGLDYLKSLGIEHPSLIAKIKLGKVSVAVVLQEFAKNRDTIRSALQDGHLSRNLRNVLSIPAICSYIEIGLLQIAQLADLSSDQIMVLDTVGAEKYLRNGKLSMARAVDSLPSNLMTLQYEGVQKYLDSGALSMDQALSLTNSAKTALNIPEVQTRLEKHEIDMTQVVALTHIDWVNPFWDVSSTIDAVNIAT